jgi:anti-sigma factor RsiW
MNIERRLLRLLSGELPEAEASALRQRLEREPELAARFARLNRSWSDLELPPAAAAPPGFAARVLARAKEAEDRLGWSVAPLWVRATAAAALVLGVVLGADLSLRTGADPGGAPTGIYESYLSMVGDAGTASEPASSARP